MSNPQQPFRHRPLLGRLSNRQTHYKMSRAAIPIIPAAPGPADAITPVAPPEEVGVATPAREELVPELPDASEVAEDEIMVEGPDTEAETLDA